MSSGFWGRLSRQWWLMLVTGLVIGIGIGFPLWGSVNPGELAGTTTYDTIIYKRTQVNLYFTVECANGWNFANGKPYQADPNYVEYVTAEDADGYRILTFHALQATTNTQIITYAPDCKKNRITRNDYRVNIWR